MAKSPLIRGSKKANPIRNRKNVVPLHLTIPYKCTINDNAREFDVSHLVHLGIDKKNDKVESRIPFIRSFCKKAKEYVDNGQSAKTVSSIYSTLNAYIHFCDAIKVNPFSEGGYLKYAGNDGELRHRIKVYNPSKKLWERRSGDELGIKESTACGSLSALQKALGWCGLPADSWRTQHRSFSSENTPTKGYSDAEEHLLVSRLSELFFSLAPQLIAAKKSNLTLPDELLVTIDLGGYQEVITVPTSLEVSHGFKNKNGNSVKSGAAFNMTMGAAYHLMCFFTSLNDSNIRAIAHPIIIHSDERDNSLQTVKVSSFKVRSNKQVDAILTNDMDESRFQFDVAKRDGVTFIKTLEELSRLYRNSRKTDRLLFTLGSKRKISDSFDLCQLNKTLTSTLNLLSPHRALCLPWFKQAFYAYRNNQYIQVKAVTNELGRYVVSKVTCPINNKAKATHGATITCYCILSCFTDLPLKGILLPLYYSEKDSDGNIIISFKYRNGDDGSFSVTAVDKELILDIEQFAIEVADKQTVKKDIRLLLKKGHAKEAPKDWKGINPIAVNRMSNWPIEENNYYISLQSGRWREMTSSQEYDDSNIGRVQSILQSTLDTINKHYANGGPRLNQIILSQGIQALEQVANGSTLKESKSYVVAKYAIPMLAHDEWLKKKKEDKARTNPNGITCDGQQNVDDGKKSQRETNKAMGVKLPCAEYDMCYKCKSARAVDDVQAVYKLISFTDALKEALDQFPDAKEAVYEKIDAYEYTLDGASIRVYQEAMALFNKNGRHPRVSINHAILSIYR